MSYIEKNTWLFGLIAIAAYLTYVVLVVSQGTSRIEEADYVWPMIGTIGGAIAAGILGGIVLAIVRPAENRGNPDARDKQIEHTGARVGYSFVIIGGVGAIVLAMVEADHFWIANLLYLAFVLSGVLSTITRVVIYRRGF